MIGRPKDAAEVRVGDAILIRRRTDGVVATPVLHRVSAVHHVDGRVVVQTKGDANADPDPQPSVLFGRTITPAYVVPFAGYVLGYARTPWGWALLVAMPAAAIASLSFREKRSRGRRPRKRLPERARVEMAS